jgi:hypothetical protein
VTPINDAPVAANDSYTTNENTALTVAAGAILANDTDVDGGALTVSPVSGPANGTVTLNPDGEFTYTPAANFNGTDSFTYTANDGQADSNVATVTLTVTPINAAVTIDQAAGQGDPTNGSPILFDVVFSEPVTGFDASDISLAGSTVGGTLAASVGGSGATYTVSVTGMSGAGTVVASIGAGAAQDLTGNPSSASTSTDNTVTFDGVPPTVTIDQEAGQPDPTGGSPILYTVQFSEPVTGFDASDISLAGSTVGARWRRASAAAARPTRCRSPG